MGGSNRTGLRRALVVALAFACSVVFIAIIAGGFLFLRLTEGPIALDLGPQITAALGGKVGGGYAFAIGTTSIEKSEHGPSLTIRQFSVRDHQGRTVMAAPSATLSVDPVDLVFGTVSPKRLDVRDVLVRVVRLESGKIAVSAGTDEASDIPLSDMFWGGTDHANSPRHERSGPQSSAPAAREAPAAGVSGGTSAAGNQAPIPMPWLPDTLASAVNGLANRMFDAAGPLHAIDRFGIRHGTLVVEDRLRKTSLTYTNFNVDFDREASGAVYLTVGADGPAGHWSVTAKADRSRDGSKQVDLAADHLSVDEVMLAGGLRKLPFESDMPVSFHLGLEVAPDERLRQASGRVSFGAGYFRLDDPDHEPAMVDSIDAALSVDPATGRINITSGELHADQTSFHFDMHALPPTGGDDPWQVTGNSNGIFGAERPGEQPIALDQIGFGIHVFPDARRLIIDQFTAKGPQVGFRLDATFQGSDQGFTIASTMETGRMPGAAVVRLWPSWVAAPIRAWFLRNLRAGTLEYGRGKFMLTDVDIETMKHQRSVPDDHVHIEFGVSNTSLVFMVGVPPLQALAGNGVITGDTVTFAATGGEMEVSPGHRLSMSDGTFKVPSTDPKPTPAVVALRVSGNIDTLADLLSRDALKAFTDLPIDASTLKGEIDGRLTVSLKLGDHVPADETKISVNATAKDFFADKLIGKEPLDNATLAIVADRTGIRAKGEGRMYGAPATIDVKKSIGGAPSEAVVVVTLDDAARAKAGFSFGRTITGPVTAKISTSLTAADKAKADVDLDFTRAAFDAPLPGLKKPAGKAAKATFTVAQGNDRIGLEQIVFDSGSTSVRGSAELTPNGEFSGAKLSQLRLSPGDDMKVDATQSSDGLKLVVRGNSVDGRPFLKSLTTGDGPSGKDPEKDVDIDLHTNLLTGQNAQVLSNADLKLSRRGGQFRRIQMSGRLGKGPATIATVGQGATTAIVISTKDAGATLQFLDLYKRMDGGRLDATLRFVDKRIDGVATVHDFTIREDPAIKKLAEEEIPSNSRNAGARIDASAVPFTKMEATFTRTGTKVDVRQGAMFGPQVGATVEGSIDFGRDRVALNGTFVPIYGINNLFSQIPVVGLLLGGGAHEGLFALNYRIDGPASAPVLTFNPLSALAPGFLRKIVGAIDNAAQPGADQAPNAHDRADGSAPTNPLAPPAE